MVIVSSLACFLSASIQVEQEPERIKLTFGGGKKGKNSPIFLACCLFWDEDSSSFSCELNWFSATYFSSHLYSNVGPCGLVAIIRARQDFPDEAAFSWKALVAPNVLHGNLHAGFHTRGISGQKETVLYQGNDSSSVLDSSRACGETADEVLVQ